MRVQYKLGGKTVKLFVFVLSLLFAGALQAQDQRESKKTANKIISVAYGVKYLGHLEVNDKELAIGLHYLKSEKHSYNFILSGNYIETETHVHDNSEWSYDEYSKGLDLSVDHGYMINMDNMVFYPSVGAVLRYSQERDLQEYSLSLDPDTGEYEWEYKMFNNNGFKLGYVLGLNLEYTVSDNLDIGLRGYLKGFPGNRMRFGFIGIIVKSSRFSF